ncbi:MAG: hypothetical protein ABI690_13570 [Chloroflexota bacterium]
MGLPKAGVSLVAENYAPWQKAMSAVAKIINDVGDASEKTSKRADPLTRAFETVKKTLQSSDKSDGFSKSITNGIDLIEKSAGKLKDNIVGFLSDKGAVGDALANVVSGIDAIPLAATIATAAIAAITAGVVALGAGFIALGNRGAPLVGLADSFDHLTASVGLSSQALLVDLRKAANGTVSDFDLIKRANLALVGTSGQFGQEFGQKLPQILAAARAAAKATGQDVDFLFESLVAGIKRASPRLIDNTGIVLKLGAANEELAKSLHKSVDQLTDEEKQIAVLNATVSAGADLISSLGDAQETNAEKQARSAATITNIFDSLAIAVQPAFGTLLDIQNRVLSTFQGIAEALAPILGAVASVITSVSGAIFDTVMTLIQPIINAFLSFAPYISIAFQAVANIFAKVRDIIQGVVGGIVHFIQDVAQHLFGIDVNNLGKNLFEGAAHIFGAFANGMIKAANALIFPAVIGIAQFIADFLVGFSPPKEGPLSQIDKGGYNVMSAWLDGITGVSLDPVIEVAAQVDAALGSVGKASLPAVNARLAQLDSALLPFQNRLDIIKSQFDAISAPAQAALDAIDRQIQAADDALAGGDQAAAERVRQLDAAREAIQGQLDAQQQLVDQQQIQLGLATASQAQERALLSIRKAALEAAGKAAPATTATTAGAAKEKQSKGEGTPQTPAPAGADISAPGGGSVLDLFGGQDAVNQAIAGIQDSFASEIDTSALGTFQTNSAQLKTQLDRIGGVDLGKKLGDKFKGVTDLFDPSIENSPANVVSRFFSSDPSTPGSFASFANGLSNIDLSAVGASVGAALAGAFIFFTGTGEGTLNGILSVVTGDATVEGSVANFFSLLPQRVSDAASGLFDQVKTTIFDPLSTFLTGDGEDTLQGILAVAVQFFSNLPAQIITALQGIGATLYAAFAVPIINVINSVIEAAENTVKTFLSGVATFLLGIADGLGGIIDTTSIRNTANDINSKAGKVNFGRVSTALPAFLTPAVPGAAKGGLFGPGAIDVGEHGKERIFAASKIGVLPAGITRTLDGLGGILAQPAPMMIPSGNTYNSNDNSSWTNNFYGTSDSQGVMRRLSRMRARRS